MSKTLEVRGLNKVCQDPGRSVEALRDLTFAVEASELVCVVGPSGCGKTTMLRCVAGLLEPTAGEVLLQGDRVAGPPPDMAVVFQEYGRSLFPWMTIRANSDPRFTQLRSHVYAQIQQAKRGGQPGRLTAGR
jgi:NitT/TauT family transport system ATP-binding protein